MRISIGKLLSLLAVTSLLFSMSFICSDDNASAQGERHDVYPGDSIQQAIDDASSGDTIYVHDDNGNPYTYHENVDVNKPYLELIGDGMDTITVDAVDPGDHTFHLTEKGITMMGFTITGSYTCGYGGICLEYTDNCTISDNNCRENLCAGIFLKHSNNCEIINNNISDNGCGGIKIASNSDHNTVKGNIITGNTNMGMNVYGGSEDNLIYNNYFDNPSKNTIDSVDWANTWNISKTSGTNIIGGPYFGGNYFSDYTGEDNDGDGLGDTPYEIKNAHGTEVTNRDYLPLVTWTPQPALSYYPNSHDFGDMQEEQTDSTTFEIWNSGTGTLTYSLSETCGWVSVNPTAGSSTGEHDTITVNIDTTGLTPDPHTCYISISSNDGSGTFAVMVNVIEEPEPLLSYSPFSHDFGDIQEEQTDSTTFEIWNSGTGTLTYSLSETCGWVSVSPTAGSSNGEHDTIIVNIDTTGLTPGSHNCLININSNGGSGTFTVYVTIIEEPLLSHDPTSHDFVNMSEGETNSTTFEIWNSGTDTLTYTLSESCSWIDIYPASGSSTGEHDTITVNIDTTGLDPDEYICPISISSNGGSGTITITVTVVENEEPILSFTPRSHDFENISENQTNSTTFEIWNSGTGTLTYSLNNSCDWVDASLTSGTSTGEHDTITVKINTTGLSPGFYTCVISIVSNSFNTTFTANVTVVGDEGSILSYTPHSHNFGRINKGQTDTITFFEIWNSGTDTLTYCLNESCSWVDISPTSGASTGERDTITVYVDVTGLNSGLYTCNIFISSTGGNDIFTMILDIPSSKLDEISGVSEGTPGFQAMIVIAGLLIVTTLLFLRKTGGEKRRK